MEANSSAQVRPVRSWRSFLTGTAFVSVVRILLGLLFVYSSADKVADPARFAVAVRAYELLPVSLTNLFALALAWAELIAGVMLVFGVYSRQAAGAVLLLLVMFIGAIAATMIRGFVVDCGCFSNEGGSQTGYWLLIRNIFLCIAAVLVMRFDRGSIGFMRLFSRKQPSASS